MVELIFLLTVLMKIYHYLKNLKKYDFEKNF